MDDGSIISIQDSDITFHTLIDCVDTVHDVLTKNQQLYTCSLFVNHWVDGKVRSDQELRSVKKDYVEGLKEKPTESATIIFKKKPSDRGEMILIPSQSRGRSRSPHNKSNGTLNTKISDDRIALENEKRDENFNKLVGITERRKTTLKEQPKKTIMIDVPTHTHKSKQTSSSKTVHKSPSHRRKSSSRRHKSSSSRHKSSSRRHKSSSSRRASPSSEHSGNRSSNSRKLENKKRRSSEYIHSEKKRRLNEDKSNSKTIETTEAGEFPSSSQIFPENLLKVARQLDSIQMGILSSSLKLAATATATLKEVDMFATERDAGTNASSSRENTTKPYRIPKYSQGAKPNVEDTTVTKEKQMDTSTTSKEKTVKERASASKTSKEKKSSAKTPKPNSSTSNLSLASSSTSPSTHTYSKNESPKPRVTSDTRDKKNEKKELADAGSSPQNASQLKMHQNVVDNKIEFAKPELEYEDNPDMNPKVMLSPLKFNPLKSKSKNKKDVIYSDKDSYTMRMEDNKIILTKDNKSKRKSEEENYVSTSETNDVRADKVSTSEFGVEEDATNSRADLLIQDVNVQLPDNKSNDNSRTQVNYTQHTKVSTSDFGAQKNDDEIVELLNELKQQNSSLEATLIEFQKNLKERDHEIDMNRKTIDEQRMKIQEREKVIEERNLWVNERDKKIKVYESQLEMQKLDVVRHRQDAAAFFELLKERENFCKQNHKEKPKPKQRKKVSQSEINQLPNLPAPSDLNGRQIGIRRNSPVQNHVLTISGFRNNIQRTSPVQNQCSPIPFSHSTIPNCSGLQDDVMLQMQNLYTHNTNKNGNEAPTSIDNTASPSNSNTSSYSNVNASCTSNGNPVSNFNGNSDHAFNSYVSPATDSNENTDTIFDGYATATSYGNAATNSNGNTDTAFNTYAAPTFNNNNAARNFNGNAASTSTNNVLSTQNGNNGQQNSKVARIHGLNVEWTVPVSNSSSPINLQKSNYPTQFTASTTQSSGVIPHEMSAMSGTQLTPHQMLPPQPGVKLYSSKLNYSARDDNAIPSQRQKSQLRNRSNTYVPVAHDNLTINPINAQQISNQNLRQMPTQRSLAHQQILTQSLVAQRSVDTEPVFYCLSCRKRAISVCKTCRNYCACSQFCYDLIEEKHKNECKIPNMVPSSIL